MAVCQEIDWVLAKLQWMRQQRIWPNGPRYLWTDAFGVVLLSSLYGASNDRHFLDQAQGIVDEVNRVLGRQRGIRIGQAEDRDGQYFHYLAMWMYALSVLSQFEPGYRQMGIDLVRQTHDRFLVPGQGVYWKMQEDLSGPYPGYGFGALDAFDGYVSYRCLDESSLSREIRDMQLLIENAAPDLVITQDLGLGMMIWMTHFFPHETWAKTQQPRCLQMLDHMWNESGYFCREPSLPETKFAFTNYGISMGLQAVGAMPERVRRLNCFFESFRSHDRYERDAITHVMACCSHFPGLLHAFSGAAG